MNRLPSAASLRLKPLTHHFQTLHFESVGRVVMCARCQAMAPRLPVMFGMPDCVEPAAPA